MVKGVSVSAVLTCENKSDSKGVCFMSFNGKKTSEAETFLWLSCIFWCDLFVDIVGIFRLG